MKKYILELALVLLFASAIGLTAAIDLTGANTNQSKDVSASIQSDKTDLLNESTVPFTLINLLSLVKDKPIDPNKGFNVTQVATGNNASTNLVQAPPGSVMKLHYHNFRDEIAYVIAGQAIFTLSGENYTAKAGDLIYIPSMTLHRVAVIGNETFLAVSSFTPPFDGKDRIFVEK